ncbi:hypothetical protein FKM82_004418 [Ascaphus truei]
MKGEDTRQRKKESRARNGERSRQRAKNKGRHSDGKAGSRDGEEEVPLIPEKRPPERKAPMAKPGEESAFSITLQVLLPYLLAGLGMVMAGMVLDVVQHWDVFKTITEVFILVPALVGLKGNLEMTLASRLSTAVRVAGNLVGIQASRISTFLHFWSLPGVLPYKMRQHWPNPYTTFFSSGVNSKSSRVLFLLVVPGHLLFLYTIHLLQGGHTALTALFVTFYLTAALLQVFILLYVADLIVRFMWRKGLDPDNFSIPYLTALGDLLGTGFLALCFRLVWLLTGTESELGD